MNITRMHRFVKAGACALVIGLSCLAPANGTGGSTAAPTFSVPDKSGATIDLGKLKGRVVMLNFWASWCGPCRTEMPLMDQIYKKYNAAGFTLLGVNVDTDSSDAQKFLSQVPVSFPIGFDRENKVSKLYDVSAMPSTVFIDRKGNVRALHRGYKPGDEAEYLAQIRALLKE